MEYKENRKPDKLAERTCLHCGKKWLVRNKRSSESTSKHLFCLECSTLLSDKDKRYYYYINSERYHSEDRKCLNCGKEWKVAVKNIKNSSKRVHFCEDCNKLLTTKEKRHVRLQIDTDYHEKVKKQKRDSHKRNIIHKLWKRAQERALKKGYDFNIEESDIIIPEKCPLLEIPIILGDCKNYENTPSLDRIDNSKGYVKGNIQVISKKANSMKNSATLEELSIFCKNILRYSLNNKEKEFVEL